jgi:hypothetical protein
VERAFAEAIREARDAGMQDDELRTVFEAVLQGEGDTP